MRGRQLNDADFSGARLYGTDLTAAKLDNAILFGADLRRAQMDGAHMLRADLRGACFEDARLRAAVLESADLREGRIATSDASGNLDYLDDGTRAPWSGVTSFARADMERCRLAGAIAYGVNFRDAQLAGSDFTRAVSDLCAGLVGGLGVTPGSNIGEDCATFEAVHGSAPDIAGQNKANPLAMLMSGVMMLNHLEQRDCATKIKNAYDAVLEKGDPDILTPDIGGRGGTREMARAIIERL